MTVRMGDVWDRTVELIGDRLGTIMPVALLAILVPDAVSDTLSQLAEGAAPAVGLGIGVVWIGLSLIQLWGQLAIAALAADPALGRGMARVATARLLPAIGVYLVLLAIALVAFAPLIAAIVASGVSIEQLRAGTGGVTLTPGAAGGIALAGLVSVILGLFIAARLMVVLLPVLAMERRGAGSIPHSFRLTRGMTWRLVGVLVLYLVVMVVALLAAQTVFGSILRLFAGGAGEPMSIAAVITAIVVAAVSTVFTVLGIAFGGRLYVAIIARETAPLGAPADTNP